MLQQKLQHLFFTIYKKKYINIKKYYGGFNMWPFSELKRLNTENARLTTENSALEELLRESDRSLNDFKTRKSLGRLIEVPRKIGDTVYVIMKADAYPAYDKELICLRKSDTVPENNIKIIPITIVGYVIRPSGAYISFREQYYESATYHININSPNLFLTMDAALAEVYSNGSKTKYMNNPFVTLQKEDVLKVYNHSTTTSSTSSKEYPSNKL
jgi:hypothetical protein